MAYIKSRKHAVARALPPFGSAAAATLFALTLPVSAQTSTNTLKEVRVEADTPATELKVDNSASPKFTAPLVDTPQTVQIIPQVLMREQGATTLSEALRNTPGAGAFYLGENGSTSTGDSIYMRGFDASSSIFVDGIRDMGSITRDVFNIDQVEVVKGPSGTDVGRTSPTGYINMISKQPNMEDAFLGSIGFGSGDYKRGTIDWNKVITNTDGSGAAFRLNAVMDDSGVAGRDEITTKRWGVAPSIAIGLNTPTRFYFNYLHMDQSGVPDGGVPTVGLPGYTSPDPKRQFLSFASPVDPSNFYGTTSDFNNVTADMFTARVEHNVTPDVILRNTTRYGKTSQDYMLTSFMGSAANLLTPVVANPNTWTIARSNPTNKDQTNELFTNQTNVSAKFNTGSVGHTMNAGLELIREEQTSLGFFGPNVTPASGAPFNTGAWPAANLYNPNPNVSGFRRTPSGADSVGSTDTVGLYAFDTAKLNEQWQLTGGVRYDHYSTDYRASTLSTATANPKLPVGTLIPSSLSSSDGLWSGKLGLVYKPAENGSIYAAWGTSAQPPGGANFALAASGTGNSASRTDFKPQEGTTYEVGTKWDVLHNKLALTAALYRTEIKNEVVQDPTSLQYYQTGKKRVQGIELGAAGAITDNWGVSAGFTTMDTEVLSGPAITASGENVLTYTPKNAFTLWTSYQFPFGLTLGGGARYNGKLSRGTDGAIGTPAYAEAYWVFDAMASYRITKNVELQLNIYNLFDQEYVSAINKSGYRYTPGIPRSARLTANFAF